MRDISPDLTTWSTERIVTRMHALYAQYGRLDEQTMTARDYAEWGALVMTLLLRNAYKVAVEMSARGQP